MNRSPITVWVVALSLFLASAGLVAADSNGAEQEIRRILDAFEKSYLEEDIELMASQLSDAGYALIMGNPSDPKAALVFGKDQTLQITARRFENVDYLEHGHEDVRIRVYGPVATSVSTIADKLSTGQQSKQRVYHIYAREKQGWRVVLSSAIIPVE